MIFRKHPLNQINELLDITVIHYRDHRKNGRMTITAFCGEIIPHPNVNNLTADHRKVTCSPCVHKALEAIADQLNHPQFYSKQIKIELLQHQERLREKLL